MITDHRQVDFALLQVNSCSKRVVNEFRDTEGCTRNSSVSREENGLTNSLLPFAVMVLKVATLSNGIGVWDKLNCLFDLPLQASQSNIAKQSAPFVAVLSRLRR